MRRNLLAWALASAAAGSIPGPAAALDVVVMHSGDAGPGSLRAAIEAVNAAPPADTHLITFNVSFFEISVELLSPLPPLTNDGTVLDGFGAVRLSGTLAGGDGVDVRANDCQVRGLQIDGFQHGVVLRGARAVVAGCHIGNNGAQALANMGDGVRILGTDARVGGTQEGEANVISGNLGRGVRVESARAVVQGNRIGVDATGMTALPNQLHGVEVVGSGAWGSLIGGADPAMGNVISGNGGEGVRIAGGVSGAAVQGNIIGLRADKGGALPNLGVAGVRIIHGFDTLLGGVDVHAGNHIGGNAGDGIAILGGHGTRLLCNHVGPESGLPNGGHGIAVLGGTDTQIGGRAESDGNAIVRNRGYGVYVNLPAETPSGLVMQANTVDSTRFSDPIGGIRIESGADILVGGEGRGNTVVAKVGDAIGLGPLAARVSILENGMRADIGAPIALAPSANGDVPPPVIESLNPFSGYAAGGGTVHLYVPSGRNGMWSFVTSIACSPDGEFFDARPHIGHLIGYPVAATFTDLEGNTSELSDSVMITIDAGFSHDADINRDYRISLSELLRVVQFAAIGQYHCDADTEDGYAVGPGDRDCVEHSSDYNPMDWSISLGELLRVVQFFNAGAFHPCALTEDGFCPGPFPE